MQDQIDLLLEQLLTGAIEFLPRLLVALGLLIVGFFIARLTERLVRRFILYLNHLINEGLKQRLLNVDLKNPAVFISKTFFWVILLITLLICVQLLEFRFLEAWFGELVAYLPNVLASVVIIFIGLITGRLAGDLIRTAASRTGLVNGSYVSRIVRHLILFIAIVMALGQVGVNIDFLTQLLTIALATLLFGAALAFGLGARNSVSNILGAYYARKTYKIGNTVEINNTRGIVVKITDHSIELETPSGVVSIPAKEFNEHHALLIN